jgi:hypothetical protein
MGPLYIDFAKAPGPAFGRRARVLPLQRGEEQALAETFLVEQVGTVDVQEALHDAWAAVPALTAAQQSISS